MHCPEVSLRSQAPQLPSVAAIGLHLPGLLAPSCCGGPAALLSSSQELGDAFAVTASKPSFSLCPVLPPSPLSRCYSQASSSSESVARKPDIRQGDK